MCHERPTPLERQVLDALRDGPGDADEICARVDSVPRDEVAAILDALASRGLVTRHHVQTLPARVVFRRA